MTNDNDQDHVDGVVPGEPVELRTLQRLGAACSNLRMAEGERYPAKDAALQLVACSSKLAEYVATGHVGQPLTEDLFRIVAPSLVGALLETAALADCIGLDLNDTAIAMITNWFHVAGEEHNDEHRRPDLRLVSVDGVRVGLDGKIMERDAVDRKPKINLFMGCMTADVCASCVRLPGGDDGPCDEYEADATGYCINHAKPDLCSVCWGSRESRGGAGEPCEHCGGTGHEPDGSTTTERDRVTRFSEFLSESLCDVDDDECHGCALYEPEKHDRCPFRDEGDDGLCRARQGIDWENES